MAQSTYGIQLKGKFVKRSLTKDWWGEKWDNVKKVGQKVNGNNQKQFGQLQKATISSTLFNKDWWSRKWE
ncbi:hypothetical protein BsIDN1_54650 [Bacillus safensis]|uniref:Uncharacterized protein n=1 Tax=Bacillus safensis TaxID=561879 RepID=A0A5S9MED5_BACIA|nr:hypothetical protein BsIDN1_54650 [Bacillus safensis]